MINKETVEVTGIPLHIVLKHLYLSRGKNKIKPGTPAFLIQMMSAGRPLTEEELKQAITRRDGLIIPDYFRGSPIKVTTEFYTENGERVWQDHPDVSRVFVGRLDLYERDNGTDAVNKFVTKIGELR